MAKEKDNRKNPMWAKQWLSDEYLKLKNKKILVINDFQNARLLSMKNEVCFLTADEFAAELFDDLIVRNHVFGEDDVVELIENWNINNVEKVLNKYDMFDLTIMNPPWGDASDSTIDVKIWRAVQHYAKKIVMISSGQYLYAKRKPDCWKSVVEASIVNNPFAGIGPKHLPVITYWESGHDNGGLIKTSDETKMDWNGVFKYDEIEETTRKGIAFFNKHSKLFNWTAGMCNGPNRKGVVHDNGQFHYYNNKLPGETYKDIPKNAKHVLCMCSYEHVTDPIHRDAAKVPGGLIWVCKNERIANNIAYWLDTPFIYMFRKRYVKAGRNNCVYDCLPQAKTFDIPENDFKTYCDQIANGFNKKFTNEYVLDMFTGSGAYSA